LDAARRQIDKLKEQVDQLSKEGTDKRTASLDQLRSELLTRIESKPIGSSRPSIMPGGSGSIMPPVAEGGGDNDRKTLLNQRALFEQIKQQFNDAKDGREDEIEPIQVNDVTLQGREMELEEELRQVRKENVELTIRLTSLEDEVKDKGGEAGNLMQGNSVLQAELQDLKFQVEHESSIVKRLTEENGDLQARIIDYESEGLALRRQKMVAEERLVQAEEERDAVRQKVHSIQEDCQAFEQRCRQLQDKVAEAAVRESSAQSAYEESRSLATQYQKIAEEAERKRVEGESARQDAESERERLKIELSDTNFERTKLKQLMNDVMQKGANNEELERDIEKWKGRAAHFEKEYNNSKQLNAEMTKVMSQMTQSISERSETSSDATKQNKILFKQLEASKQAERAARLEKEDIQKQYDSLQSTGNYFQEKYREAANESRQLKQENSVATASLSKMRIRLETFQKENDDMKAQCAKLQHGLRLTGSDTGRVQHYEETVRDLQMKMSRKDADLESTQAMFEKSQQVNDCLNSLLALETEQKGLYEQASQRGLTLQEHELEDKRSKASHIISRLNEIMQDDERASRPSDLRNS